MARNDAFLLSVPPPAPRAAVTGTEPTETHEAGGTTAHPAGCAAVEPSAEELLRQRLAQLTHCPHCRVRLSAIDLKMNRCFGCGKVLASHAAPQESGPTRVVVRI